MGKGGGSGGGSGRGKGGCQLVFELLLALVLLVGPVLLAVGIPLYVTSPVPRDAKVSAVQSAVSEWSGGGSGPNTAGVWLQQRFTAVVSPASSSRADCSGLRAHNYTLQLDTASTDWFTDMSSKFCCGAYPQARFTATIDSNLGCGYDVVIQSATTGEVVASFTQPATPIAAANSQPVDVYPQRVPSEQICPYAFPLPSCSSPEALACSANCGAVNSTWTCDSGGVWSCRAEASFKDLCVKVAATWSETEHVDVNDVSTVKKTVEPYALDRQHPSGDIGCNVIAAYIQKTGEYDYNNPASVDDYYNDHLFVVANLTIKGPATPLTLTLRNSHDPWLVYMAQTQGTGYLGDESWPATRTTGVVLICIGSVFMLAWVALYIYCCMLCCCRPHQKPKNKVLLRLYEWKDRRQAKRNQQYGFRGLELLPLPPPQQLAFGGMAAPGPEGNPLYGMTASQGHPPMPTAVPVKKPSPQREEANGSASPQPPV